MFHSFILSEGRVRSKRVFTLCSRKEDLYEADGWSENNTPPARRSTYLHTPNSNNGLKQFLDQV